MTLNRRDFASRLGLAAGAFSALGVGALSARAQTPPAAAPATHDDAMGGFFRSLAANDAEYRAMVPPTPRVIAMLAYPGMFPLDLIGPHSVLSGLANTRVRVVWKTKNPIPFQGFTLTPDTLFEECPEKVDVLFVPGGGPGTIAALNDPAVLSFLQTRAASAGWVTSVCTGSLVLAAAGLLDGRRATTHWVAFDVLEALGATPVRERVVEDGNVITAAGVSAGIDFALALTARMTTPTYARASQLNIEYDPQPPFSAGTPEGAGEVVTSALRAMYSPIVNAGLAYAKRPRN